MTEKKYNLITYNSIKVKASLEESFLYFADLNNYASWFPEVVEMKEIDNSPISKINKAYEEKVILDDSGNSTFITVQLKEFIENRRIITRAEFMPLLPQMTISCKTLDSQSVSIDFKFESRSKNEEYLKSDDFASLKDLLTSRAKKGLKTLKDILEN